MADLLPAGLSSRIAALTLTGNAMLGAALGRLAAQCVRQAILNASNGSHAAGTPTPARPGQGPAVVSGGLRRAITHTTPVPTSFGGWLCFVGMAAGIPHGSTTAGRIGFWLETGLKNGSTYPFLIPAVRTTLNTWKFGPDFVGW